MNLKCSACGFDLLDMPINLCMDKSDFYSNGIITRKTLHCPICDKGALTLSLDELGIVPRVDGQSQVRLYQWHPGSGNARAGEIQSPGKLTFSVKDVEFLKVQDLLYKEVPAFMDHQRRFVVPTFPIRPEYFDLLDMDRIKKGEYTPGRIDGPFYCASFPLRGMRELFSEKLSVMTSTFNANRTSPDADAFQDAELTLWPDVRLECWKFFRLELKAGKLSKSTLFDPLRPVLTGFRKASGGFQEFNNQSDDGNSRYVVVDDGRPEWLFIQFGDNSGGIFSLWSRDMVFVSPTPSTTMVMGVDLGTSNSCVAFGLQGQAKSDTMGIRNLERRIFGGASGDSVARQTCVHVHPPVRGFGKHGDVLPTEILLKKGRNELLSGSAAKWIPFQDYTIPSSGILPGYDESDHILSEFKFDIDNGGSYSPEHQRQLYERYLEALLLVEIANAYRRDTDLVMADTVDVRYSFPGVFSGANQNWVQTRYLTVTASVGKWTGLNLRVGPSPVDEATAAGQNVSAGNDGLRIYVDMGGGTTDIAVFCQTRANPSPEMIFQTSVKYAGGVMVRALVGEADDPAYLPVSCLQPKQSVESLKRFVREQPEDGNIYSETTVFNPDYKRVRTRRAELYFGYLNEILARLIAAAVINREFENYIKRVRASESEGNLASLNVELVLLGNGWGFLKALDSLNSAVIADILSERVRSILKGEKGQNLENVAINITSVPLPGIHPKAAVAKGLLSTAANRHIGPVITNRTIVGEDTHVGQKSNPTIKWHTIIQLPYLPGSHKLPVELNDRSDLNFDHSVPGYPQSPPLVPPTEYDPNLARTGSKIVSACLPDSNIMKSFRRSPYEVMMEVVFANAIPKEGA